MPADDESGDHERQGAGDVKSGGKGKTAHDRGERDENIGCWRAGQAHETVRQPSERQPQNHPSGRLAAQQCHSVHDD
jgi:hypothetical protein